MLLTSATIRQSCRLFASCPVWQSWPSDDGAPVETDCPSRLPRRAEVAAAAAEHDVEDEDHEPDDAEPAAAARGRARPRRRPRTSVTCEGSSLAPLRNRIASLLPGTGTLIPANVAPSHRPGSRLLVARRGVRRRSRIAARRPSAAPRARLAAAPTTRELVGQRLVVAMGGHATVAALLGRIRRGEVGGVILFGANITSPAQLQRPDGAAPERGARGAGGRRS